MSKKKNPPCLTISTVQQMILASAPTISLIGLMGSGKSTVGRILSATLSRPFFDSDDEIVQRTGASISTIFEIEGELGFRERESKVIKELCEQRAIVLATGGGAVLREDNREALCKNSIVVYLSTTPERLLNRTRFDHNRPLLQNTDRLSVLKQLHEIRHPIYLSMADVVVSTGSGQVSQVAINIIEALIQKLVKEKE